MPLSGGALPSETRFGPSAVRLIGCLEVLIGCLEGFCGLLTHDSILRFDPSVAKV